MALLRGLKMNDIVIVARARLNGCVVATGIPVGGFMAAPDFSPSQEFLCQQSSFRTVRACRFHEFRGPPCYDIQMRKHKPLRRIRYGVLTALLALAPKAFAEPPPPAASPAPHVTPANRVVSVFLAQDFINEQLSQHVKSELLQKLAIALDPENDHISLRGVIRVPIEELRAINLDPKLGKFPFSSRHQARHDQAWTPHRGVSAERDFFLSRRLQRQARPRDRAGSIAVAGPRLGARLPGRALGRLLGL